MGIRSDPPFFIKVINEKLILWDYRNHAQYEISPAHVQRLLEIARGAVINESKIDREIAASGVFADDRRDLGTWGWDCLSQIFHIGTQIVLKEGGELPSDDSYEGYVAYCASIAERIPEMKYKREGETIELPAANRNFAKIPELADVLMKRRTSRSFSSETIPLQMVADVLHWTFGTVHGDTREDMRAAGLQPVGYRRTSPSGGSLHPSEAYVVALQVAGLRPGIYHYSATSHQLTFLTGDINGEMLGRLLCAQMFARNLAFGAFITCRFDKMWWKYPHSRAYRVALLDIGCLAQTFQLVTTSIGLRSWLTGYFLDREINRLLALDEVNESVLFFVGAGRGEDTPFAPEMLASIEKFNNIYERDAMLILGFKPGHDGHIAAIDDGVLKFSYEAEKDSNPRYAPIGVDLFIEACAAVDRVPDAVAVSGWTKGCSESASVIGGGYWGIENPCVISSVFVGEPLRLVSDSHERSHIMCAYGMSPFPQGQACYVLVWEGHIGSFYFVDAHVNIKKLCHVLDYPGIRYAFAYGVADPTFNFRSGQVRLGDAGKLMALAAFGEPMDSRSSGFGFTSAILSDRLTLDSLDKQRFSQSRYFNIGVESREFKDLARTLSDRIFDLFYERVRPFVQCDAPLLISGGCGLNCDWNRQWVDSGLFTEVFVPPCPNDVGSAIGTAVDAQFTLTGCAKIEWNVYSGQAFIDDLDRIDGFCCSRMNYNTVAQLI